ncbi:MAG: A/G-specific adenine glycosylase [Alphaproteobacteria bacterium]
MRPAEPGSGGNVSADEQSPIARSLLDWYDRNARRLPWRVGPEERALGVRPDPYRVWLSEVMLQQTTVAAVQPYFEKFVRKWPTLADLAAAETDEIMRGWAGLGYYSRARNLKATANAIASAGGSFPETSALLRRLPGIGDYTAAAIAAIVYDEPSPVVDGNIERVIARLFVIAEPLPAAKSTIRARQAALTPSTRAGDYAQAMMDLGATICTPKRPACGLCPIDQACLAKAQGDLEAYPLKRPKPVRPTRCGIAYVAVRKDRAVLLRKRDPAGLLGGMAEVPGSDWAVTAPSIDRNAPLDLNWREVSGKIVHIFTHFRLELGVLTAKAPQDAAAPNGHWWSPVDTLPHEALPSVMKKAIEAAAPGSTRPKTETLRRPQPVRA